MLVNRKNISNVTFVICLLNFVKYIFVYQTMSLQKSAVFWQIWRWGLELGLFSTFLVFDLYVIAQSSVFML